MNLKKAAFYYLIISLLTILVLAPDLVFFFKNKVYNYAFTGFFVVQALVLIPVVIFSRRLKIYYWILAIIVSLTPIMLFPVFYMNIQVNAEMVGLVLDTNTGEMMELMGWKVIFVILAIVFLGWLFLKISSKLPSQINWKQGAIISLIGIFAFGILPLVRSRKLQYYTLIARNTFRTYYPFRLYDAMSMIRSEMKNMERYKEATKNFKYNVQKKDPSDTSRHVYVLVIGEAARYDHWGINGYNRNTSPEIQQLNNIFTFSDVASGGTMTILSVPQLITRANAPTYDLHKREKSILAAFKEAGYYSCWISNQSKYGLTGNIGMHFNDGDTAMYCGHGENEGNFTGSYDIMVVDDIKKMIATHPGKDVFMIIHLIGSHWRYVLRYPEEFQVFKPTSDRNSTLLQRPPKEQIVNEYDNSILYTDHILATIAKELNQPGIKGSMMFISDHGENLDDNNDGLYFHSYIPNHVTAKVPLFIWLNDRYAAANASVIENLKKNKDQKISSAESVFYTMIDMAGLTMPGFDSTKNLSGRSFLPSKQMVLGENGKLYNFNDLK